MQISSIQNSLTAIMSMHTAQSAVAKASERISTGLRVNSAADDPAGAGVANKLKVQVGSFSKVLDNLSQGTGIVQVVDDSLTQMVDALSSLRVASVASMGTLSTDDRNMYQTQVDEYLAVIDSISSNAMWNGESLMSDEVTKSIQSGINSGDTTSLSLEEMTVSSLSLTELSVASTSDADASVELIDTAIGTVSNYQSYIGAMENVLDIQSNVATSNITNYSTAYGHIMNADMAQETSNLASAQIQRDAATAMLAQSHTMNKELVAYLLMSGMS
ncbi:flagellin [Limnohabitans sp. 2KL-27]|jgi:flagellin|uniref:flagellin n=1 Tax=Limnohabitans sp. 2KL-27 TaxID=1100705 RepID=UPI000B2EC227|nr:flagellin [Limnohabitans sp. 2KL-27]